MPERLEYVPQKSCPGEGEKDSDSVHSKISNCMPFNSGKHFQADPFLIESDNQINNNWKADIDSCSMVLLLLIASFNKLVCSK